MIVNVECMRAFVFGAIAGNRSCTVEHRCKAKTNAAAESLPRATKEDDDTEWPTANNWRRDACQHKVNKTLALCMAAVIAALARCVRAGFCEG